MEHTRAHHFLASLSKRGSWVRWKKAMSVIVIMGAMIGGVSGTAQAATSAAAHIEQSDPVTASSAYFSAHLERNRSSALPSMLSGTVAAAATRCPAFKSWEDYGGARVHAYVDFHPSDLCNGRHVKRAYVHLIRQCGPYYDSGRIYT